jgi:hypothetical protein
VRRWCVPIDLGERGFTDATVELRDDGTIVLRVPLDEDGPVAGGSTLLPGDARQIAAALIAACRGIP